MLEPAELRLLTRLRLVRNQRLTQGRPGGQLSHRSGRGLEFSDFRSYVAGDDLRQVDWAAYARHEKMVLRLGHEELERPVNVAIDRSLSMAEGGKLQAAVKLAHAIVLMAGMDGDGVRAGFCDEKAPRWSGRGQHAAGLSQRLAAKPKGKVNPARVAALPWLRSGLTVVISDLYEESWPQAVVQLGARGMEPVLWQMLSPLERNPELAGDLELEDSESGEKLEITIGEHALHHYRQELEAWQKALSKAAGRGRGGIVLSSSQESVGQWMASAERARVVRPWA